MLKCMESTTIITTVTKVITVIVEKEGKVSTETKTSTDTRTTRDEVVPPTQPNSPGNRRA